MPLIRVGIIGFGKMGQIRATTARSIRDVQIAKVYDKSYDSPPAFFDGPP